MPENTMPTTLAIRETFEHVALRKGGRLHSGHCYLTGRGLLWTPASSPLHDADPRSDRLPKILGFLADLVNIIAISSVPQSIGQTFHVTRDDYESMKDVTDLISEQTGQRFDLFDLSDFVPEVIRRCTRDDLLFPLLDFLVGSVDNISSMEFKRYDNTNYRRARNATNWGQADSSLNDTVTGILRFMDRKGILQV